MQKFLPSFFPRAFSIVFSISSCPIFLLYNSTLAIIGKVIINWWSMVRKKILFISLKGLKPKLYLNCTMGTVPDFYRLFLIFYLCSPAITDAELDQYAAALQVRSGFRHITLMRIRIRNRFYSYCVAKFKFTRWRSPFFYMLCWQFPLYSWCSLFYLDTIVFSGQCHTCYSVSCKCTVQGSDPDPWALNVQNDAGPGGA